MDECRAQVSHCTVVLCRDLYKIKPSRTSQDNSVLLRIWRDPPLLISTTIGRTVVLMHTPFIIAAAAVALMRGIVTSHGGGIAIVKFITRFEPTGPSSLKTMIVVAFIMGFSIVAIIHFAAGSIRTESFVAVAVAIVVVVRVSCGVRIGVVVLAIPTSASTSWNKFSVAKKESFPIYIHTCIVRSLFFHTNLYIYTYKYTSKNNRNSIVHTFQAPVDRSIDDYYHHHCSP